MSPVTLNQIALAIFLAANIAVGLYASRGLRSMREYILADKQLGVGLLVMTLIATVFEARDVTPNAEWKSGLIHLMCPLALSFSAFLIGWRVLPKLLDFQGCATIADVMAELYGSLAGQFTVVVSTIVSALVIMAQLVVLGDLGAMSGLAPAWMILLLGGLITIYTALGGLRSVVYTDALQFFCIGGGMVLFVAFCLHERGGLGPVLQKVSESPSHFAFWRYIHPGSRRVLAAIFGGLVPTILLFPPVVQRVLAAPNKHAIRHMFLGFSLAYPIFRMLMVLIGFCLFKKLGMPSGSMMQSMQSLSRLAGEACSAPLGQMAFLLAMVALLMSTIDSFLSSLAILWVHNVILPLAKAANRPVHPLLWTRLCTLAIGAITTGLAAYVGKAPSQEMISHAITLFSILTIPFLAGVYGFRTTPRIFWRSVAVFGLSFLLLALLDRQFHFLQYGLFQEFSSSKTLMISNVSKMARTIWFYSILLSTLAYFVSHYLEFDSFQLIERSHDHWQVKRRLSSWMRGPFLVWLTAPVAWANAKVEKYGKEPFLLAFFLYLSFLPPYPLQGKEIHSLYVIYTLRAIGVLLCTLLLLRDMWPEGALWYFNAFYFLTIFHCVPFTNILTAMSDPAGMFSILNIVLGMLLLTVLVDWRTFLGMEVLGLLLSRLCHTLIWWGRIPPRLEGGQSGLLVVSALYALLVCLVFARKKQALATSYQARAQLEKRSQASYIDDYLSLHQQLAGAMHPDSSMMLAIKEALQRLQGSGADEAALRQISYATRHLQQVANKSYEHLPLHTQKIAVADLLSEVRDALQSYGVDPREQVTLEQDTTLQEVVCDPAYIIELLANAIRYLAEKQPRSRILFAVQEVPFDYHLPAGSTPAVPVALRFVVTSQATVPEARPIYTLDHEAASALPSDHVLLVRNHQIIRAHYGLIYLTEKEGASYQEYILPALVHLLRPTIPYFSEEDLLQETRLDLPEERAFLDKLTQKVTLSPAELEGMIRAMKRAKYHHRRQPRESGEPYYMHPLAVADMTLDHTTHLPTLQAALLHDVLEDTPYTLSQMAADFGEEVAKLVGLVSQIYNTDLRKVKVSEADSHAAMFRSEDQRACLIKLCDRLHNMRTIDVMPPEKQVAKAEDTKAHFVSMGQDMGLKKMAEELDELADRVLQRWGRRGGAASGGRG